MVPGAGLEPARPCGQRILRLLALYFLNLNNKLQSISVVCKKVCNQQAHGRYQFEGNPSLESHTELLTAIYSQEIALEQLPQELEGVFFVIIPPLVDGLK